MLAWAPHPDSCLCPPRDGKQLSPRPFADTRPGPCNGEGRSYGTISWWSCLLESSLIQPDLVSLLNKTRSESSLAGGQYGPASCWGLPYCTGSLLQEAPRGCPGPLQDMVPWDLSLCEGPGGSPRLLSFLSFWEILILLMFSEHVNPYWLKCPCKLTHTLALGLKEGAKNHHKNGKVIQNLPSSQVLQLCKILPIFRNWENFPWRPS